MLPSERVRRVALSYMQQRVRFELWAEQRIVAGVHHIHFHDPSPLEKGRSDDTTG